MKTISLKLAESLLKEIDEQLEIHRFSTRTEFVREAIRDKLEKLENQHFETEIRKYFRENKHTILENEKMGLNHDVFKELETRFGAK